MSDTPNRVRFDLNKIDWAVNAPEWGNPDSIEPLHLAGDQVSDALSGTIVNVIVEVAPEYIRQTFNDVHWYAEITVDYGRGQMTHKWYV